MDFGHSSYDGNLVIVSGAGGFLGRALIRQLSLMAGCAILALTSQKEQLALTFAGHPHIRCISPAELANSIKVKDKPVTLIHGAFSRQHRSSTDIADSLRFTSWLFQLCVSNKVDHIINISSQGVYGQASQPPWTEETKVAPDSLYGLAKYASELLLASMLPGREASISVTNLRLASLTGPGEALRPEVVSKFVGHALKAEPIHIVGGEQVLSYLDVRDAVSAIICLLSADPKHWRLTYNLGSDRPYNIVEIAEIVADVARRYVRHPVAINIEKKEIRLNVGMDSRLFYGETGWQPAFSLHETIDAIFRFHAAAEGRHDNDVPVQGAGSGCIRNGIT